MILSLAKLVLAPGSLSLFILGAVVAAVLAWRGSRSTAIALGATLTIAYLILSLPAVAERLGAMAERGTRPRPPSIALAPAVVVLDGDNSDERIDEAIRLVRAVSPAWLIASGNREWSADVRMRAVQAGFPRNRVVTEPGGRTTRDQALRVRAILRDRDIDSFILVASTVHMPRALAIFHAAGLCPIPSASPTAYRAGADGSRKILPQWRALDLSRDAIYEIVAWHYYQRRGWVDDPVAISETKVCSADTFAGG